MELVSNQKYSLGHRALILFFFHKLKWSLLLFAVGGLLWYMAQSLAADSAVWTMFAAQVTLFTAGIALIITFLVVYLEYRVYTYMFTNEAFIVTSGLIMRKEIAALYHQVQNVNIQRSPLNRLIGVSEIIILMTGSDTGPGKSEIILPAVGRGRAKLVQQEILKRARRHLGQSGDGE